MGWFFVFIFMLLFAIIMRQASEERKVEGKREDDRLAKLKALYPDKPTYEERMGAQYGPTGPQDTSGE